MKPDQKGSKVCAAIIALHTACQPEEVIGALALGPKAYNALASYLFDGNDRLVEKALVEGSFPFMGAFIIRGTSQTKETPHGQATVTTNPPDAPTELGSKCSGNERQVE